LLSSILFIATKLTPSWQYVNKASGINSFNGSRGGDTKSWWDATQPCSPYEQQLKDTLIDPPSCVCGEWVGSVDKRLEPWSQYDALKFMLGLRTLERISSFFRMLTNRNVMAALENKPRQRGGGGGGGLTRKDIFAAMSGGVSPNDPTSLLALDMQHISFCFQSCSSFFLQISHQTMRRAANDSWMIGAGSVSTSLVDVQLRTEYSFNNTTTLPPYSLSTDINSEVKRLVERMTESFLSVIVDMTGVSSPAERRGWGKDLTACIRIALSFPPHSFVFECARSIEEEEVE
jgi:hypothetical protein